MMRSSTAMIAIVTVALVVRRGLRLRDVFISPSVEFNDDNCELVGDDVMAGSEDMALGKGGILFITSGDLKMVFSNGSASASPGGIFVMDMRGSAKTVVKLTLNKFPDGVRFQPHGLHVSNSSDHLLATSHAGSHSRVEVFRIEYHTECSESQPWSCPPATLHHLNSITSDHFPNCGMNDVVEGSSPHELYATQWLTLPYPEHGIKSQSQVKTVMAPQLLNFMGFSWTRVYRCTWSEGILGGQCEPVTGRQFYGANGITISHDRKQLFVNDPLDKRITIMDRQEDGKLLETGHIDLPWFVDNVEMDGEDLVMGTISDIGKVFEAEKDPSVGIPGGMLVARRGEGGDWKVDEAHSVAHDGSKLSQMSAAARWGNKVVLGSPFSRGVLVCHS